MAKVFSPERVPSAREIEAWSTTIAKRLADSRYGLMAGAGTSTIAITIQGILEDNWAADSNPEGDGWMTVAIRPQPPAPPALQHDVCLQLDPPSRLEDRVRREAARGAFDIHLQRRAIYELPADELATMILCNGDHEWIRSLWNGEGLLHRMVTHELATETEHGARRLTTAESLRWLAIAYLLSHPRQKATWQHRAYLETPLHRIAAHSDRPNAMALWDLLAGRLRMASIIDQDSMDRALRSPNILGANIAQLFERSLMRRARTQPMERREWDAWRARLDELWYMAGGTPVTGNPGYPRGPAGQRLPDEWFEG